jgi:hypothetical protein
VDFGTSITMTASTNLKVERAIYFVLFSSENRSKMLRHLRINEGIGNYVSACNDVRVYSDNLVCAMECNLKKIDCLLKYYSENWGRY